MRTVCIIPARYGATRFRAKVLASLWGKPVIQHVYENALRAKKIDEVVVATDHKDILRTVKDFGGRVVMTSTKHRSGTDRIAEAARKIEGDIIINVQGDEPLVTPSLIDTLAGTMQQRWTLLMATLSGRLMGPRELKDPNIVKVITDKNSDAIYFSRYPIPYVRDKRDQKRVKHRKHIGIYAYRRQFLFRLVRLPMSALEKAEKLEQLRALENGYAIRVVPVRYTGTGVDTRGDLERIRKLRKK